MGFRVELAIRVDRYEQIGTDLKCVANETLERNSHTGVLGVPNNRSTRIPNHIPWAKIAMPDDHSRLPFDVRNTPNRPICFLRRNHQVAAFREQYCGRRYSRVRSLE